MQTYPHNQSKFTPNQLKPTELNLFFDRLNLHKTILYMKFLYKGTPKFNYLNLY